MYEFLQNPAVIWLAIAVFFAIIEAFTTGLTSIWFSGGAIAAMLTVFAGAPLVLQVAAFAVVSAVLLVMTRPLAKKHVNGKTVSTNADALIGTGAMALERFAKGEHGRVRAEGKDWAAVCEDADVMKGEIVNINEIRGVTLIVSPLADKKEDK